jgi:ABC-type lipoprotein export system ATPase subunit
MSGVSAPDGVAPSRAGIAYTLTGVTKTYQKGRSTVSALRDVNLVIGKGEWLAVQGRTGHGKTTLLQILGGLDRPDSGTVRYDGQDLGQLREAQATKMRAASIGFIFQTFNLVPTLSAAENVEAALIPLGTRSAKRRKDVAAALQSVGLADRAGHLPLSCPEGSSSGSRSPVPWSSNPACFWPTSRRATSTRTPGTRSSRCWRNCGTTCT